MPFENETSCRFLFSLDVLKNLDRSALSKMFHYVMLKFAVEAPFWYTIYPTDFGNQVNI